MKPHKHQDRTIVVHFANHAEYLELIDDHARFRAYLLAQYAKFPELFPSEIAGGFHFHGFIHSKKLKIRQRRIRLKQTRQAYQIRPSTILPYMTAMCEDVSNILSLRAWAVPYWKMAELGGRNAMFWYRQHLSLGRFSIVGTTVKRKENLPEALIADEKHTRWREHKVYVATTVAKGCILGAAVADRADEANLHEAYGVFAEEAKAIEQEYEPKSVTLDGWEATHKVWTSLYSGILLILCFLHGWLGIKKRCKRQKEVLEAVGDKVWDIYKATNLRSFSQRVRRLKEWAGKATMSESVREKVLRFCEKAQHYKKGLLLEGSPRTSNGLDRLMDHQDRQLYGMRYLHGYEEGGQLMVRAIAQMWNFHGYGPRTMSEDQERGASPFEDLNGFRYHQDWLQNFNIASSLQRKCPSHKNR